MSLIIGAKEIGKRYYVSELFVIQITKLIH